MGDINYAKVIIAGLVAGLVVNVIGYVAFDWILAETMAEAFAPLGVAEPGVTQIALFWVIGFIHGIVLAWVYAAFRPRFGPGVGTAMKAGLTLWVVGSLQPSFGDAVMGIFTTTALVTGVLAGLVQFLAAGWVAGYLYQEGGAAPAPSQPAE